jgi:hypothetical protein
MSWTVALLLVARLLFFSPYSSFWIIERGLWNHFKTKLHGDRRLSAKLVPTFAGRGCYVVSVTGPYVRILGFLDGMKLLYCLSCVCIPPRTLLLGNDGTRYQGWLCWWFSVVVLCCTVSSSHNVFSLLSSVTECFIAWATQTATLNTQIKWKYLKTYVVLCTYPSAERYTAQLLTQLDSSLSRESVCRV